MAITGILNKENNEYKFTFPEVYYKIDEIYIDVLDESIRIGLRGYPDSFSRENKGIGIYKEVFDIKLTDISPTDFTKKDLLRVCYEYLMSLDEFKKMKKC